MDSIAKTYDCLICEGTGTFRTINSTDQKCMACNGTGHITREFLKEQVLMLEEDNLKAMELLEKYGYNR